MHNNNKHGTSVNSANLSNPIFTLGSPFNHGTTALGDMYGIGYTTGSADFIPNTLTPANSGWGMYVAADGDARIFLNGSNGDIGTSGDFYQKGTKLLDQTRYMHDGNMFRETNPQATFGGGSSSTGYIKVNLPTGLTNRNIMMVFKVHVKTYNPAAIQVYTIKGYLNAGATKWAYTTVNVDSTPDVLGFEPVKFCTSGEEAWILIGSSTKVWSYLRFWVTDFVATYQNFSPGTVYKPWVCSVVTTATDVIVSIADTNQLVNSYNTNILGKNASANDVLCEGIAISTSAIYCQVMTPMRTKRATAAILTDAIYFSTLPTSTSGVTTTDITFGVSGSSGTEVTVIYLNSFVGLVAGTRYYMKSATASTRVTIT